MSGSPTVISTADVARLLNKSGRTVIRLVDAGELTPLAKSPGLRGAYLFDAAEVENYISETSRSDEGAGELPDDRSEHATRRGVAGAGRAGDLDPPGSASPYGGDA